VYKIAFDDNSMIVNPSLIFVYWSCSQVLILVHLVPGVPEGYGSVHRSMFHHLCCNLLTF